MKHLKLTDINHEFWNLTDTVQTANNYVYGKGSILKVPKGIRVDTIPTKFIPRALAEKMLE
jgi:hypothetical protein